MLLVLLVLLLRRYCFSIHCHCATLKGGVCHVYLSAVFDHVSDLAII
jgi:hypothetical protein